MFCGVKLPWIDFHTKVCYFQQLVWLAGWMAFIQHRMPPAQAQSKVRAQWADLVWLQGWSGFVNFVPEEYLSLTETRMAFWARNLYKIYLMHIYTFHSLKAIDNSEGTSVYIWFPISFLFASFHLIYPYIEPFKIYSSSLVSLKQKSIFILIR